MAKDFRETMDDMALEALKEVLGENEEYKEYTLETLAVFKKYGVGTIDAVSLMSELAKIKAPRDMKGMGNIKLFHGGKE